MDLLTKVVLYAAVLIIVLAAVYYGLGMVSRPASSPTSAQASANITNYLYSVYDGSSVTINNVTPSVQYPGSWHVVASVVENASTPCPAYQVYTFDYPRFGLVNRTETEYTTGLPSCLAYYQSGKQVGSAPIAVTLASKNATVADYIAKFGFRNVLTAAQPGNVTVSGGLLRVWNITYSSGQANYSIYAVISQVNGSVISTQLHELS